MLPALYLFHERIGDGLITGHGLACGPGYRESFFAKLGTRNSHVALILRAIAGAYAHDVVKRGLACRKESGCPRSSAHCPIRPSDLQQAIGNPPALNRRILSHG